MTELLSGISAMTWTNITEKMSSTPKTGEQKAEIKHNELKVTCSRKLDH